MKYSGVVLDPNAFHYMDTNSSNILQEKKKRKSYRLNWFQHPIMTFIWLLLVLLIYLAIMHLNNTKHENDQTKDHDTREIKSYSIIKWSIKDLEVKNGLIYDLSQNIICSQNKVMCNHKRKI